MISSFLWKTWIWGYELFSMLTCQQRSRVHLAFRSESKCSSCSDISRSCRQMCRCAWRTEPMVWKHVFTNRIALKKWHSTGIPPVFAWFSWLTPWNMWSKVQGLVTSRLCLGDFDKFPTQLLLQHAFFKLLIKLLESTSGCVVAVEPMACNWSLWHYCNSAHSCAIGLLLSLKHQALRCILLCLQGVRQGNTATSHGLHGKPIIVATSNCWFLISKTFRNQYDTENQNFHPSFLDQKVA